MLSNSRASFLPENTAHDWRVNRSVRSNLQLLWADHDTPQGTYRLPVLCVHRIGRMYESGRRLLDNVLSMQVRNKSLHRSWRGLGYTGAWGLRGPLSAFNLISGYVDEIIWRKQQSRGGFTWAFPVWIEWIEAHMLECERIFPQQPPRKWNSWSVGSARTPAVIDEHERRSFNTCLRWQFRRHVVGRDYIYHWTVIILLISFKLFFDISGFIGIKMRYTLTWRISSRRDSNC